MRKGKMVSQGGHVVHLALLGDHRPAPGEPFKDSITVTFTGHAARWLQDSFTKATVGVESEAELIEIYEKAQAAGLPCSLIVDSGKTEFNKKPTRTAVAIGPALVKDIDVITGHLDIL